MMRLLKTSIIASVLGSAICVTSTASAQSTPPIACPGYEKGKTTLVGERTGKKVQRAFEAYQQDLVDEALQILLDINASDDFDSAYVNRFVGNLLAAMDGQGERALGYLNSSVTPRVLNDTEHTQTLRLIGDLSMQEKKYANAIKHYEQWMDVTYNRTVN